MVFHTPLFKEGLLVAETDTKTDKEKKKKSNLRKTEAAHGGKKTLKTKEQVTAAINELGEGRYTVNQKEHSRS